MMHDKAIAEMEHDDAIRERQHVRYFRRQYRRCGEVGQKPAADTERNGGVVVHTDHSAHEFGRKPA